MAVLAFCLDTTRPNGLRPSSSDMPVSHSFRSRHNSPPSTIATPARTGHRRSLSSNPGTIISSGHQQKLNVVTRVAIEGKARRGQDGASIRMFLKVRVSCRCWHLIFILSFFTHR